MSLGTPRGSSHRLFAASAVLLIGAAGPRLVTDGLEPTRTWIVYDDGAGKELDFARLCRGAGLPCGAVLRRGERLSATVPRVGGATVYDLVKALLAAHPDYRARFVEGALDIAPLQDRCSAALDRPLARRDYRAAHPAEIAAGALSAAGQRASAADARALARDFFDASRYRVLELEILEGATARQVLDGAAAIDGMMMWSLESAAACPPGRTCEPCGRFTAGVWRGRQAASRPPVHGQVPDPRASWHAVSAEKPKEPPAPRP